MVYRAKSTLKRAIVGFLAAACVLSSAVGFAGIGYAPEPSPGASPPSAARLVQPDLQPARVVRVVDGDTLVIDIAGVQDKVRLIGVDAPESVHPDKSRNNPAGIAASDYMKTLVAPGQVVWLQKDVSETDRYGRLLRYVWLDVPADAYSADEVKAKMLNARIEESGHARAMTMPPDTAYSKEFEHMEGRMAF